MHFFATDITVQASWWAFDIILYHVTRNTSSRTEGHRHILAIGQRSFPCQTFTIYNQSAYFPRYGYGCDDVGNRCLAYLEHPRSQMFQPICLDFVPSHGTNQVQVTWTFQTYPCYYSGDSSASPPWGLAARSACSTCFITGTTCTWSTMGPHIPWWSFALSISESSSLDVASDWPRWTATRPQDCMDTLAWLDEAETYILEETGYTCNLATHFLQTTDKCGPCLATRFSTGTENAWFGA